MIRRRFSTLLSKDLSKLTLADLKNASQNDENGKYSIIKKLNESNNANSEFYNHLVSDFSSYYKLQNEKFNNALLTHFININPGRVLTTYDLFDKHLIEVSEELLKTVFDKLVLEKNIHDLVKIKEKYPSFEYKLEPLVDQLIADEDFISIRKLALHYSINLENLKNRLGTVIGRFAFLEFFKPLQPQSAWAYVVLLNLNFDKELNQLYASLNQNLPNYNNEVLKIINESSIDLEAENLDLRISILKVLGMVENNIDETLKKFHLYQSKTPYGIENIKIIMCNIFAYQAILTDEVINLQIAEYLMPSDIRTINLIQILIIMNSNFNTDKAMKIFNEFINKVSEKGKAKLIESIIIGHLLNNDRNFAHLVFEKSIENKVLVDDKEIAKIKKIFKSFSDCFMENEDWSIVKFKFKQIVLTYVQSINSVDFQNM
ncbi:unnamed protein product [Candida verbasci]|uniref:Uncharacterized protein n=1 Tax=Candida verbasci TaxID=1227364 RepID=A0A9W4XB99_9ASCO|nr:unnamed protein product [Candida verbasci]